MLFKKRDIANNHKKLTDNHKKLANSILGHKDTLNTVLQPAIDLGYTDRR